MVVCDHTSVVTSHAPVYYDLFRDPWTHLASHHVSLTESVSIFHNKQEISFTCKKKNGLSSVGSNWRCWQVTGMQVGQEGPLGVLHSACSDSGATIQKQLLPLFCLSFLESSWAPSIGEGV